MFWLAMPKGYGEVPWVLFYESLTISSIALWVLTMA